MKNLLVRLGRAGAWLRRAGRALVITEPYRLRAPPFHVVLRTGQQRLAAAHSAASLFRDLGR